MQLESTILAEIDEQRPNAPLGLLSRAEKDRAIERGITSLYRWYLARSQATRNWNPDLDFDWRSFSTRHSDEVNTMLEGFYAVEQYVPDYVKNLLDVIRQNYGRAQFHVRWGAEEQRHMDAWRNTVLFARRRSLAWLEQWTDRLRAGEWLLPWDDPLHMLFYTVVQERATQVTYVNMADIAAGRPGFESDADPVLERVARTIAIDEAAHYNFFNECARLHLYYYPAEALEALVDVLRHFSMPGTEIIPNFPEFEEIVARSAVFGPRQYATDVLRVVMGNLDVKANRALAFGIQRSRQVPDEDGNLVDTTLLSMIDYPSVEEHVGDSYRRIAKYEAKAGRAELDPTEMVPSRLAGLWQSEREVPAAH
jgi:acyl-[acyl-carrier-protein] desaturase